MTKAAPGFTEPQRSLIGTRHSTYVEACPGAGKTQVIVQRFIDRPAQASSRRGVALISFTNAAVDEARSRCASDPGLLQVPNFVGTIDAFINRFIVGPVFSAVTGRAPTFRDTWSSVPTARVRLTGIPGIFPLDWFDITLQGAAKLVLQRVPPDRRNVVSTLRQDQQVRITEAVGVKWRYLCERGVLDAATSRMLMAEYLRGQHTRQQVRQILAARFCEVIVDEVQDCTEGDVQLLELIAEAGSTLICVGDPDQAIYGFRGPGGAGIASLRSQLTTGERLNGNFRSSPAICKVVGSLRHGSMSDVSVGDAAEVTLPLTVVPYKQARYVPPAVTEVLAGHDLAEKDVIVLAHAAATSRACAGVANSERYTESRLVSLATSVFHLQRPGSTATARRQALFNVERIVCELNGEELMLADFLEGRGLTERAFRERCLRIATSLEPPFTAAPSQFKRAAVGLLTAHGLVSPKGSRLKTPNGDKWPVHLNQEDPVIPHSTIHAYKGLQHRAVVLVLPPGTVGAPDDGVAQWIDDQPGESRRVLYVGASRAKELLILAVHDSRMSDVLAKLDKDEIDYVTYVRQS